MIDTNEIVGQCVSYNRKMLKTRYPPSQVYLEELTKNFMGISTDTSCLRFRVLAS